MASEAQDKRKTSPEDMLNALESVFNLSFKKTGVIKIAWSTTNSDGSSTTVQERVIKRSDWEKKKSTLKKRRGSKR